MKVKFSGVVNLVSSVFFGAFILYFDMASDGELTLGEYFISFFLLAIAVDLAIASNNSKLKGE